MRSWSALVVLAGLIACGSDPVEVDPGVAGDGTLATRLESIRARHSLPALATLLLEGDHVVETAATGVRADGSGPAVTPGDRWHLGSLTKAMTATLAARLVDRDVASWDVTVGDVFPDLVEVMDTQYVPVSLRDLLRHTSGLPLDASLIPSWPTLATSTAPVPEQRRLMVSELLRLTPEGPRGTFNYSDSGYIVAGAMLEELTGESWEALLQREVFGPLGMSTAGFGAPGTTGLRDQPLGHRWQGDRWLAVEPGAQADNPAAFGPAGTVHASLSDYARFMALHLAGARGESEFLEVDTFRDLYTPPAGSVYASGWGLAITSWTGGVALSHIGSNELWFAVVWIVPARNFAIVAVTNSWGNDAAEQGVADALDLLIQRQGN